MKADLVLEGGGVKGIALVGALSVLEEAGYEFNRVAGTSAGAIVGALVASGMRSGRMTDVMKATDFRKFMDKAPTDFVPVLSQMKSLALERGMYVGKYFHDWLSELLAEQGVRTFADLRLDAELAEGLTDDEAYRLVVMVSDITRRRLAKLPWDYPRYGLRADEIPVADAVRASMSIPFFFAPVTLRHGQVAPDTDPADAVSTLVDGGLLSNFPIAAFDRRDGKPPRWPTIGIRLSSHLGSREMLPSVAPGPFGLALDLLATMIDSADNEHMQEATVRARTIFVDTTGVSLTNFGLNARDQDMLYANGRAAAEEFLSSWDFWAYVQDYRTGPIPSLKDVPLALD